MVRIAARPPREVAAATVEPGAKATREIARDRGLGPVAAPATWTQRGVQTGVAEKSPPGPSVNSDASKTPNATLATPDASVSQRRALRTRMTASEAGSAIDAVTIVMPSTVPRPNNARYANAHRGSLHSGEYEQHHGRGPGHAVHHPNEERARGGRRASVGVARAHDVLEPEDDEHERDGELHRQSHARRNRDLEQDDRAADEEDRQRVTDAP